ncbi:MAG: response regulator transcription factor [Candidatus Scalindua sp.]|nr:response regulator transcription factor [Candidatus Scalindua sp.]
MPTRVAICCCSYLFGEGIKRFIEELKLDINAIINYTDNKEMIKAKPDLLITDFFSLCNFSHEISPKHKVQILLLGTGCLPKIENHRLRKFLSQGLIGILSPTTNSSELKKVIEGVISGELWIARNRLQDLIPSSNGIVNKKSPYLTKRETEIVKMICNGHSNKEIMKMLNISEPSVKSHLSRIYKKTGVSDRLQLALFASTQVKLY